MVKYFIRHLVFFKIGLVNAVNLRGEMLIWALLSMVEAAGILIFWWAAFRGHQEIGGFTLTQIFTYYLIGRMLSQFINCNFDTWMVGYIRRGDIAKELLKPFSVKLQLPLMELSWRLVQLVLFILPFTLLIALFNFRLYTFPGFSSFCWVIIFCCIGYIISALLNLYVLAFAFIFEQANSLTHLRWTLIAVLGGSLLPLELMPDWLKILAYLLPFQYLYSVPINLYLNQYSLDQIGRLLTGGLFWIAGLSYLLIRFWQRALKSYAVVGN